MFAVCGRALRSATTLPRCSACPAARARGRHQGLTRQRATTATPRLPRFTAIGSPCGGVCVSFVRASSAALSMSPRCRRDRSLLLPAVAAWLSRISRRAPSSYQRSCRFPWPAPRARHQHARRVQLVATRGAPAGAARPRPAPFRGFILFDEQHPWPTGYGPARPPSICCSRRTSGPLRSRHFAAPGAGPEPRVLRTRALAEPEFSWWSGCRTARPRDQGQGRRGPAGGRTFPRFPGRPCGSARPAAAAALRLWPTVGGLARAVMPPAAATTSPRRRAGEVPDHGGAVVIRVEARPHRRPLWSDSLLVLWLPR